MANIFLLGPGWWDAGKGVPPPDTPLNFRKHIAEIWRKDGHTVLLMEEAADVKGETILQKFDRLLRQDVTHVVIYWPPLRLPRWQPPTLKWFCCATGRNFS